MCIRDRGILLGIYLSKTYYPIVDEYLAAIFDSTNQLVSLISVILIFSVTIILTKILLNKDIREIGSGNIGATNALITVKKFIVFTTLILDVVKDRAVSLSLANNLVTESWGNEYTLGLGYRVKNLRVRSNLASNGNNFIGDLNTKIDLNLRKNITVIRNLDIDNNKFSEGQSIFSLKIIEDYALSKNFSAIFFYDHLFSKYEISTAFPQTNIRSGFTFRYSFGN